MTTLIIVESPNKTTKIAHSLGSDYIVEASFGHICDLPENELGIDQATLQGNYRPTEGGQRTLKKLKAKMNGISQVLLATDPDREGESIAAFLTHYLGIRNPIRVKFNEITPDAIRKAVNNPTALDWKLVEAREARRLIDRLIGYLVTPPMRSVLRQRGPSAGRVQTPAEALVIERARKIRNHVQETFYTVTLEMGGWQADWQIPALPPKSHMTNADYDIDDNTSRCMDIAQANQAAQPGMLTVLDCATTQQSRLPPAPLVTVTLIQLADQLLSMNADRTMKAAQKLFEGPQGSEYGYITYHRTDSPNLSDDGAAQIRSYIQEHGQPVPEIPNKWKNAAANAQEAHEAIRPTDIRLETAGDDPDQQAIYKLIRDRALISQLPPAQFRVQTIKLVSANQQHQYQAIARTLIYPGWLSNQHALSLADEETGDTQATANLPQLTPGTRLNAQSAEVIPHKTKAPAFYTTATLAKKLEKLGIGRPATYASIFNHLEKKGTITVVPKGKQRYFHPTQVAEAAYDILYPNFSFAHIGYTGQLEKALDQVANNQINALDLVRSVWNQINAEIGRLPAAASVPAEDWGVCPECGKPLNRVPGKRGDFLSCSGYRDKTCKYTANIPSPAARKSA